MIAHIYFLKINRKMFDRKMRQEGAQKKKEEGEKDLSGSVGKGGGERVSGWLGGWRREKEKKTE